jgi:aminopeptidase N
VATNLYSDPGVMFDQHTYPKGGVLLTSLRKMLGDKLFFAGLNRYLTNHQNSPVETNMLCVAMTEATGINLHPWFDQWILKPGHPVIEWSWSWDGAKKEAVVHVKQTQDVSSGTPIYDIPAKVALLSADGQIDIRPIHLNAADQEFRLAANSKPATIAFDPDHDFLREIPKSPWTDAELPVIARYAPNCVDRQSAFSGMLAGTPSDAVVRTAVETLKADKGVEPAILSVTGLAALKRPDLRGFWESELTHENFARRTAAVNALADLPANPGDVQRLRGLIDDKQPYSVVAAAMTASAKFDYPGSASLIANQAKTSQNALVRGTALGILVKNKAAGSTDLMFQLLQDTQPDEAQQAGIAALTEFTGDDPRFIPALRAGLKSGDFGAIFPIVEIARKRKIKELLPDLEDVKKRFPFLAESIDRAIKEIKG